MIDKFVLDIKSYTASMSGCTSPQAIIMIGVSFYVLLCALFHYKLGSLTWLCFDMWHFDFVGWKCWPETYPWKVRQVFFLFPLFLFFILLFGRKKIVHWTDCKHRGTNYLEHLCIGNSKDSTLMYLVFLSKHNFIPFEYEWEHAIKKI